MALAVTFGLLGGIHSLAAGEAAGAASAANAAQMAQSAALCARS